MRQLGLSLSAWQAVERQSYLIYKELMKGSDNKLISVTFFHIQSFSSKIDLLEKCLSIEFGAVLKKEWKELRKNLDRQTSLRNRIVHFPVLAQTKGAHVTFLKGYSLDDETPRTKSKRRTEYDLDIEALHKAEEEFLKLADELKSFRELAAAFWST